MNLLNQTLQRHNLSVKIIQELSINKWGSKKSLQGTVFCFPGMVKTSKKLQMPNKKRLVMHFVKKGILVFTDALKNVKV